MNRRSFLVATGTIGALSGCTGNPGSDQSEESPSQNETPSEAESPEQSGTPTESETESDTPEPAAVSVSNVSVSESTVTAGDTVTVTVTVENTGGESGSETLAVRVDQEPVGEESVDVNSGESTTVEFTFETTRPKTYTVSVADLEATVDATATDVGGVIDSETTWTVADGPYQVVETVQVSSGSTLTIEPGVSVWAGDGLGRESMFLLHGEIIASGSSSEMITFDAAGSSATFFDAENSSPEAFLEAEYCVIRNGGPFWMRGYGGFNLRHSELRSVDASYIWYPYQIAYDGYDIRQSEVNIEYNTFIDSGGFSVGHDDRSLDETVTVNIRHNAFSGFTPATYGGLINNWASYGSSETVVEYNSFLGMTDEVVLKLPEGYEDAAMTASNNYWGTTDEGTIGEMVFDSNDNIQSGGEIDYGPTLESPHPDTPSIDE
jgi:hypothetical protein